MRAVCPFVEVWMATQAPVVTVRAGSYALCAACATAVRAARMPTCVTCRTLMASAPEGWEHTVERMKEHDEIDNPFALAHWMKHQGYTPHDEQGGGGSDVRAAWGAYAAARERAHALQPAALPDDVSAALDTLTAGEWDEDRHPRDEHGRFAPGSGPDVDDEPQDERDLAPGSTPGEPQRVHDEGGGEPAYTVGGNPVGTQSDVETENQRVAREFPQSQSLPRAQQPGGWRRTDESVAKDTPHKVGERVRILTPGALGGTGVVAKISPSGKALVVTDSHPKGLWWDKTEIERAPSPGPEKSVSQSGHTTPDASQLVPTPQENRAREQGYTPYEDFRDERTGEAPQSKPPSKGVDEIAKEYADRERQRQDFRSRNREWLRDNPPEPDDDSRIGSYDVERVDREREELNERVDRERADRERAARAYTPPPEGEPDSSDRIGSYPSERVHPGRADTGRDAWWKQTDARDPEGRTASGRRRGVTVKAGDAEGTHPEPDGDEIVIPGVGRVEPHDIPEPVHASASYLRALTLAAAAAADSQSVRSGVPGRLPRRCFPPEPRRYVLHAEAGGTYALPRIAAALGHPNRIPFKAVLHPVDAPSDKPPNGAQGHRVIIPRAVAARNLHTLIGMGVNMQGQTSIGGHNVRNKIGIITHAAIGQDPDPSTNVPGFLIDPNAVMVAGWLYGKDFPAEVKAVMSAARSGVLGTSYEVSDVTVADPDVEPWTATNLTYTGMAALRRDAAAYHATQLAASAQ